MKRDDWSERMMRTKNWMMDGKARYFLGMAGKPKERELRDMKTNVWSVASAHEGQYSGV